MNSALVKRDWKRLEKEISLTVNKFLLKLRHQQKTEHTENYHKNQNNPDYFK